MKNRLVLMATVTVAALLIGTGALAQQGAPPRPAPTIEIFGCKFNPNKGMNDLHSVATRWNAWADKNKMADYTAFIATPFLHSAELQNDVLWLGGWPNAAAMATDSALSATKEGREIDAAFDAVGKCTSHALYAELVVRQPKNPPPENGVAEFSDCTVRDGRTVQEAITALGQVSEYFAGRGSEPFSAMLFPLAGRANNEHYTFKAVLGFDSVQAYGKNVDLYTAGGFVRVDELLGRVLDCNSPRVYALERTRLAAAPTAAGAR